MIEQTLTIYLAYAALLYDDIFLLITIKKYSNISLSQIEKWRKNHDYKSFNDSITKLLDDNNIHIKFRKRKFDHFLWFPNK